jgi:hypothetical protein
MSDTGSHEVNNNHKQDSNNQEKPKNPDNVTYRKNLILLKPESYGTIRMVSSQTYHSSMEKSDE